jgi:acetyl esterase/lipase
MKKTLLIVASLFSAGLFAQLRYLEPVFTQVQVTSDVTYGTNVDLLKNLNIINDVQANLAQAISESQQLQTALATNQPIDPKFYDPANTTTIIKVSDIKMDVYEPVGDTETERPVVVYLHTGNFLPPVINGSLAGSKADSSVKEICTRFAERGFVAVAINYRLGWDPQASGPTGVVVRRATLLNAVYRAIHDTKKAVRFLRADAASANTYGIDTNRISLFGEGSGGYVAVAYSTLDKLEEMEIQKFVFPGTQDSSYIQPSVVGGIDGYGGLLNIYQNNGLSAEIDMTVNIGGALADTSWLEAGDAPMVSFHAVRDPFAPFDEGTVIVPTTNEQVVDVQGANVFVAKANDLGNNTQMNSANYNDAITAVARAKYGNTYSYFSSSTITVRSNAEGLFPIVRPLVTTNRFLNEGSPWQWWGSGLSQPSPRPAAAAKTFIDTIMAYAVPRMMVAMQITGFQNIGQTELALNNQIQLFPNPAADQLNIALSDQSIALTSYSVLDLTGKVVLNGNINEAKASINTGSLPSGVYMLQINTNKGNSVQRFVKK